MRTYVWDCTCASRPIATTSSLRPTLCLPCRKHEPDLILLDLGLPAGDGFVVMDRLKAVPALAIIPIIVVSGRAGAANQERVLKAGAKAFLEKPVDNAELLAVIRQALGESVKRERPLVHDLGSL
jgi:CheY-like chemotaxis protein